MKPEAATQTFAITGYKRVDRRRERPAAGRADADAEVRVLPGTATADADAGARRRDRVQRQRRRPGDAARCRRRSGSSRRLLPSPADAAAGGAGAGRRRWRTCGPLGAVRQADIKTAGPAVHDDHRRRRRAAVDLVAAYHANLGDVVITTTFADYQDVNGLKLPAGLAGKVDDFTTWEIQAASQALDADVGDLAAPAVGQRAGAARRGAERGRRSRRQGRVAARRASRITACSSSSAIT